MFEQVKQEIDNTIKTNGNNEITATRLNGVLQDMMDAAAEEIENVAESVGDQVEANPTGEATIPLNKIKIGETIYKTDNPFSGAVDASDAQRLQALANVSNQEAGYDSSEPPVFTGKMGYVVLQPEKAGDTTTTFAAQIANKQNTIFEIRDVYDLGDANGENPITIPSNCTLKFNGGMIKNGVVVGNNSIIEANYKIFDNIVITGSWECVGNVCWWANGCSYNSSTNKPIDNDETVQIQLALDSSFKEVVFKPIFYCISQTLILRNAKNITLTGTPNTNLQSSNNSKKPNATYIYTRNNIDILDVSVYKEDPLQIIRISNGAFDASLCDTDYTSNIIKVSTGNGQKIWNLNINTTVFGKNKGTGVMPGGRGVMIGDVDGESSAGGYATMIRIDSHFQYLNTAVHAISDKGWVTDVVVDGFCESCAKAVYSNATNTDVRLSIQTAAFFDINTKETNAAVSFGSSGKSGIFSISSYVWDLDNNPNGTTRYSNAKSLEILGNSKVEIYGSFASQAAHQGVLFYKRILGSVNQIYGRVGNLPSSVQFPYDFNRLVPNALNDMLLGADLTGLVTTSIKLLRYDDETYVEDNNITIPQTAPLSSIYRDNKQWCTIQTGGDPLGESDYFQLEVEFTDDQSYPYIGKMYLYFRKFSGVETIANQPKKCEASIIASDNSVHPIYSSYPTDYSTGGFFGDYIEFTTPSYGYTTKKIIIKIYANNASSIVLYRLSAFEFFNNATYIPQKSLHTPYVSRCGGDVYGNLNLHGSVIFDDNSNIPNGINLRQSSVISNNELSSKTIVNLLPEIQKINVFRFTTPTTDGRFQYSYFISVFGTKSVSPYYPMSGLYVITFSGSGNTTDNTKVKFSVRKIFSSIDATFNLFYKANSDTVIFDVVTNVSTSIVNTRVIALNTNNYLSVVSAKASGSTERPSNDSNYILIDNIGDSNSYPNTNYIETGFQYFDTTLGKYICWNGTAWVNLDSTPLADYTITKPSDSNIIIDNNATSIEGNKTYIATLTANSGYSIDSVKVTIGGVDVTSFVYNSLTGVIYIAGVTGNIVITATATQNT